MSQTLDLNKTTEREVLVVNVGKQSFSIPLAKSLSVKEARAMSTREGTIDFMLKYIPDKLQEQITLEDLNTICDAWLKACDSNGTSVGE